jgi:hypothetical protein
MHMTCAVISVHKGQQVGWQICLGVPGLANLCYVLYLLIVLFRFLVGVTAC